MALLNRELDLGFKYLHTSRTGPASNNYIREDNNCLIWLLRTWEDHDYFYIEFFQGDAFDTYPIDTLVPEEILDKIRTDNHTFLYLANTHEAFLDIVEPLYNSLVRDAGIPAHKIYIANEAADLGKAVKKYADENNLEYMKAEWLLEFEESISIEASLLGVNLDNMLVHKPYPKRYLNFNRRWRLHRPTLVALLYSRGLLPQGYVSLARSDDCRGWNDIWWWIKSHHNTDPEISKMLSDNEQEIINMPELYLDTDELVENKANLEDRSKYLYENTLLSIVTETTFYHGKGMNEARFLSEKIFKPIAMGHPFIFVTVPKSLELLKEIGYKTFHPYIDESYDNEFDDCERLKKILKEIERICNFTDEQIKEFIDNVRPICEHNHNMIISKTKPFLEGSDPKCEILHSHFVRKLL